MVWLMVSIINVINKNDSRGNREDCGSEQLDFPSVNTHGKTEREEEGAKQSQSKCKKEQ